ncbi:glycoside hydrolase family 3 C-terminal domain-containing protein [Streptomyces sp. FH025]|uniref:glycoside hydrolase family 3 C-terminal domain-containing protein n=1 Tax=Streptomyces sp. FH025 TaxID=2815937 RepID=UPI001A9DDCF4|nr:glycoside hydrolase family 3 C-terminal domain-containing protein [Streptomyces sp. FH025]MBO1415619.1 glycoside hydrolase family 3 C-terminal domain-containing protein [Streptomyces sp. FH025]
MPTSPHTTALIERLTLEQKVRLLTGASMWSLHDEPAVGLRPIVVSDGPTGVRGIAMDDRDPSASLPSASCVSATWDLEQVRRLGSLIAAEARAKGVDVVLGPTVNLHRSPRGGRHFEAFSEDPYLTGEFGAAYVASVQAHGVATTAKHYVANDSETDRFTVDVRADEQTLREVYLAPFERMVDEGAWLVMSAYNTVNGAPMSANPLLRDPLKDEWGFDGVVISDWGAVRDTEPSAASGLDLVMPGPDGPWGEALVEAVKAGRVPESAIDEKVARLLLLAARVGALDSGPAAAPVEPWDDTAIADLLRETAADGMVLARNDGTLPVEPRDGLTVGVIGQHALRARTQGGGSAAVFPHHVVTPLEGLRDAYGDHAVTFAPGLPPVDELHPFTRGTVTDPFSGADGIHVRYLDQDGAAFAEENFPSGRLGWLGDPRLAQAACVELTTRFTADRDGRHDLGFAGVGGFTFEIDGEAVSTDSLAPAEGDDPVTALLSPPARVVSRDLSHGQTVELRLTCALSLPGGFPIAMVRFGYKDLFGDPAEEFRRAIEVAAASDVAVVVVGTTETIESEGFDRPSLGLPEGQDELVRRVAEVNPRTVVVVNSGAPVVMPWLDEVAAVVLSWFPGQEFGAALADVLTGAREPGGRLPTTWPAREEDVPVWVVEPHEGRLAYTEGVHVGYRAWLKRERTGGYGPALPFGSGLGYTSWRIDEPTVSTAGDRVVVLADVTNTGARPGKQVLQAYLSRPESAVERPVSWLAGFTAVRAEAGERVLARIEIAPRAFQHWDTDAHGWATEPGTFTLRLATSAADPGHTVTVTPATGRA